MGAPSKQAKPVFFKARFALLANGTAVALGRRRKGPPTTVEVREGVPTRTITLNPPPGASAVTVYAFRYKDVV